MRKLVLMLGVAAASMLAASAANAETGGGQAAPGSPDVTVRAPERMVCRSVTRTSTRMRASRVCRPVSQINAEDRRTDEDRIAEAADTLEMLGEKVSTNCTGGMGGGHSGPLGPR